MSNSRVLGLYEHGRFIIHVDDQGAQITLAFQALHFISKLRSSQMSELGLFFIKKKLLISARPPEKVSAQWEHGRFKIQVDNMGAEIVAKAGAVGLRQRLPPHEMGKAGEFLLEMLMLMEGRK